MREDLDAFPGAPPLETKLAEAWVTSIVDINSCGPELAEKLALQIPTALYQKPDDDAMRAEVIYERERRHLKIVVSGDPGGTANLLSFIRIWQEQFG